MDVQAITITALIVSTIGLLFKLVYDGLKKNGKPINGAAVDLSGVETKIDNCTTAIIDLTAVSSETKGTVDQIDKRIDGMQQEFARTQNKCSDKFTTIFDRIHEIESSPPTVKKK